MEALFQLLNGIHPMSDALQQHLNSILQHKKLKKRKFLLKEGHVCSEICFIQKGLLHCFHIDKDKKITSWLMPESNVIISVKSFLRQIPSHEFIQALEDCELYYINYQELQTTYRLFPEFNFNGRVLTENYYILENENRHQMQIRTIRERFDWFLNTFPGLITRAPSRHIATFLGVTEETLSRIRSE